MNSNNQPDQEQNSPNSLLKMIDDLVKQTKYAYEAGYLQALSDMGKTGWTDAMKENIEEGYNSFLSDFDHDNI